MILDSYCLTKKRPWGLQKDGDLWELFERLANEKGLNSLLISWVKGHAKQKDIDEGRSSPTKQAGNNAADDLADLGVADHCSGLLQLANYYASKQRQYRYLIHRIHKMF